MILEPTCFEKVKMDESDIKFFNEDFLKLSGRSLEWVLIELIVFVMYLFTLLTFMVKSRIYKVGIDQTI